MKEYEAYLFDADGTIIDTREMICQSFKHMGEALGVTLPDRSSIESTIGLPVMVQVKMFLGEGHPEEFYEKGRQLYSDRIFSIYPDYLRLFPGAAEVLAELHRRGKKLAVVTSRKRHGLNLFLGELGVSQYFSVTATPEDTEKHKPDAEPALYAARMLGVRPGDAVFVGDARFDVECGRAAGMDTVLVEWGGMDHGDWPVQPDYVAKTFYDLLPEG